MNDYEIIPREGFGELLYEMSEKDLITLGYKNVDFNELTGWFTYCKSPEFRCYVKDGKIEAISCSSSVIFKGTPIIGLKKNEIEKLIGYPPDEIGDPLWVGTDIQQITWEYYDLGMQLWFEKDNLVTVICDNGKDEE